MEIENIYNLKYLLLYKCDSRVTFTQQETEELERIQHDLLTLDKSQDWKPLMRKTSVIQIKAENRFMNFMFGEDSIAIIHDAKLYIDKVIEMNNPLRNPMISKMMTEENKIQSATDATIRIARMHLNYGIGKPLIYEQIAAYSESVILDIFYNADGQKRKTDKIEIQRASSRKPSWVADTPERMIGYRMFPQSPPTNAVSQINTKSLSSLTKYFTKDSVEIEKSGLSLMIEKYGDRPLGWNLSTSKLIDFISLMYHASKDPLIFINLKEYMETCNLKDENNARKQLLENADLISRTRISFKGKNPVFDIPIKINILDLQTGSTRNGTVLVHLSEAYQKVLEISPVMNYPMIIFTFNEKKNPNSYYFLRKISENKNMNYFKKNADILSLKKLLESSPNIKRYDDISKFGRIKQRIIIPFERDMDALHEVLTWDFIDILGSLIQRDDVDKMPYTTYIKLNIKVTWKNYPTRKKPSRSDN